MSKTAIVVGATGLIGRHVVEILAQHQDVDKVITLTRRPVLATYEKVDNHVVDFEQLEQYAELFNADVLFSCLGTTLKQAGSIDAQRRVDVDYQLHAAQIAAQQGVKHLLLVSSSGANADSRSPYLKMKGELEHSVLSLPFEQTTILQPSLLLGERDGFRLGESIGARILPALCSLPFLKRYRPIQGQQVAQKMVELGIDTIPSQTHYRLDELF